MTAPFAPPFGMTLVRRVNMNRFDAGKRTAASVTTYLQRQYTASSKLQENTEGPVYAKDLIILFSLLFIIHVYKDESKPLHNFVVKSTFLTFSGKHTYRGTKYNNNIPAHTALII